MDGIKELMIIFFLRFDTVYRLTIQSILLKTVHRGGLSK